MVQKISPVSIPTNDSCTFVYVPVVFDNVAVSELIDLSTSRVVGVFWDDDNDVWGMGLAFNMALDENGTPKPVSKVSTDGTAIDYYQLPTLPPGYTAIDIDTLAGVRYLQLVADLQPGVVVTGQIYLVVRELT